ncbi:glycosyltransferase [Candidatus Bipolaricaulota bacterium]|nr:glycosyltransferase [Candidatus Bipolaricaulota bacterium]
MRIGLFSDAYLPEISGVTTAVHWLKEELERLGHEAYIYAPAYKGFRDKEEHLFRFRARRFIFHKASRVALPYSRKAARSFKRLDIVHSHTPFSLGLVAVGAATLSRIPHVHTYHTHLLESRHYLPLSSLLPERETEKIIAAFCNRCAVVTAPSLPFKEKLVEYGVHRPIHILPSGVNLSLFRKEQAWEPRQKLAIPAGATLFLYAGRLAMEKNLPFLVRAFARLHEEDREAVLVIAGDGPKRKELEDQVEKSGLSKAVRFAGFLAHPQLIDLYRAADLFLFSSKAETQGLVLLEAMAGGTPVVAIGELGVLDIVCDGINGLFAPEEEKRFARIALDLMNDSARYAQLKEGALKTAKELSAHSSTLRLLEIFNQCLAVARKGD